MKTFLKFIATAATLAVTFPATAAPTLLKDADAVGYNGPQLNLTGYNNGLYNFTPGPVTLPGGITFTAQPGGGGNSGQGSVIGQGIYGLVDNGYITPSATYIGLDSDTGYAELTFTTAVSSFGGYWNYLLDGTSFLGDAPTLSAFDIGGDLIASFDLSVVAPISFAYDSANQFAFRGIAFDTALIKTFRFGGSYMVLAGTADGSIPVAAPIPEPETYAMLLAGLGLLSLVARRRRKSA